MKNCTYLWAFAVLLSTLCFSAFADTHFVWTNSPSPTAPYTNWTTAATSIQNAVTAAASNDTVLVTNGTYVLQTQVMVPDVTVRSVNGPANTTVDGNSSTRCFYLSHPDAFIDGFTITGGYATNAHNGEWGGGVAAPAGGTIRNCVITNNSAPSDAGGGGIAGYMNTVIEGCTIISNTAGLGGGIASVGDHTTVSNCTIIGNSTDTSGGGIYSWSTCLVQNCTISDNTAGVDGGGVFIEDSASDAIDVTIEHCLISGNSAIEYGGGVYLGYGLMIRSCTIISNAAEIGGGVYSYAQGIVENCVISNNTAASDGGGVYYWDVGDIANCAIGGNSATNGGGIWCYSTTVSNCTVDGNVAYLDGGGVFSSEEDLLQDCVISNNRAERNGGGVYDDFTSHTTIVERCAIIDNSAGQAGGGMYFYEHGIVQRSAITGNSATNGGGTYCLWGGTMRNCVVSGNVSAYGGGMYSYHGGQLQNCTVSSNSAEVRGGGTYIEDTGTIENTIVYFNSAISAPNWYVLESETSISYTCTLPLAPGEGNITNDPQIMADCELTGTSPCIDAGTNLAVITADFIGVPRPLDGNDDGTARHDIGAYEYVHPSADTDSDKMPDRWEMDSTLNPLIDDATADLDNDAFQNICEYTAATDPTDDTDFFQVEDVVSGTDDAPVVSWDSVTNRLYTIFMTMDLVQYPWTNVVDFTDLPGTGDTMSYTNTSSDAQFVFYSVTVKLDE